MSSSAGPGFPTSGMNKGHAHLDTSVSPARRYIYIGGNPLDIVNSWTEVDLATDPDFFVKNFEKPFAIASGGTGADNLAEAQANLGIGIGGAAHIIQHLHFFTGVQASGTLPIPSDNSKPQNDEGTEFMTLAITPTKSTNSLVIRANTFIGKPTTSGGVIIAAVLFQDSIADALAIACESIPVTTASYLVTIPLVHEMIAGTTDEITFKIRAGFTSAGTYHFNSRTGAEHFGGINMSFIEIIEMQE